MSLISRNRKQVVETLYSKHLCCYPAENEASKLFVKWLKEHPEYSVDDVDMEINTIEREEDYYGNGGGVDNTMVIYKTHEETDEEYEKRINEQEKDALDSFMHNVGCEVLDLIQKFNIYPNLYSDAIEAHKKEITDAIFDVVKNKIKNKH